MNLRRSRIAAYVIPLAASITLASIRSAPASAGEIPTASISVPRIGKFPVRFEVSLVNWAMGFSCHGLCIDSAGDVHVYDCTSLRDSLRSAVSDAKRAMIWARRFAQRDTVVMHIDTLELNSYLRLLPRAAVEHVTPRRQTGADIGSTTFTAYWADAPDSVGCDLLLGKFGDWTTRREGPNTAKLVEWLKQIEAELADLMFRK